MYICESCEKIYSDSDKKVNRKHLSIFDIDICDCGGEIVKANPCEKCGKPTPYYYSICLECANEQYKNLDTMLELGNKWQDEIKLNGFLLHAFDKDTIEQILIDALKRCDEKAIFEEIEKYYDADKDCFWEEADRKWKKEK